MTFWKRYEQRKLEIFTLIKNMSDEDSNKGRRSPKRWFDAEKDYDGQEFDES